MAHYEEHPSRASGFRRGELVVHPDAAESDCIVWFRYEPGSWEGLPAVRVGADRVRVSGVPYWVYDLNLGDDVRVVASAEGGLVAETRTRESSNYTFRVVFDGAGPEDDRWRQLMNQLAAYDCWFDVRTPGMRLAMP